NGFGVQLHTPLNDNNLFYRNSFISNGVHVFDNGTANFWNNTMVGNYWDNYTGFDLNNDNIGDTPFNIPGGANSIDNLPIVDHGPPSITINTPTSSGYGATAPEFNIFVNETYIYSMWYTINNGDIKYYITENDTINQDAWSALNDGNVLITFYARDIAWNIDFESVIVIKDDLLPEIAIIYPTNGLIWALPLEFIINFSDVNFDKLWVTINYSNIEYGFIASPGNNVVIDLPFSIWNLLPEGHFLVKIYVNDTAGNVNYAEVTLIKELSPELPSLDAIFIIVISIIVISAIIIAGIVIRKLPKKDKIKKSRKLSEEQLSKAQYFQDVTSILTILAIHNDSGLCLSKIAIHGGIGLDENLFTGFISAMGNFKDELAKQMGLPVGDGGGGRDNVIEYNEFTITLMDGEYLRLGLVSHNSLGDLIKEQCGQVLRAYEIKHVNDLKNFDGEIQIFNDFEDTIETGLDLNLNKKSIINIKQLNKYDAPESFITILNDLNSRFEGLYPAELTSTLVREMNISDQEANFMVYEAYKNQIFSPIKIEK
ncbi:MAG: hypothetical protein V3W20_08715, partial [Candidatus Neomarinimicrobiota bacterium]